VIINVIDLYVKYLLFLSDFNELEFSRHIFEIYFNTKLNENLSSGSRFMWADGQIDRRTDMRKLIVAFRNFASTPKMASLEVCFHFPFIIPCILYKS
jgi:hypothetical protein